MHTRADKDRLAAEHTAARARAFSLLRRGEERGVPMVEAEVNGQTLRLESRSATTGEAVYAMLERQIAHAVLFEMGRPVVQNYEGQIQWVRKGPDGLPALA